MDTLEATARSRRILPTLWRDEPFEGFADLRRRHPMTTLVFVIRDVVALGLQPRDELARGETDGHLCVVDAVREEEPRLSLAPERRHQAAGEHDHVVERIAVREAHRQRVTRSVGDAA